MNSDLKQWMRMLTILTLSFWAAAVLADEIKPEQPRVLKGIEVEGAVAQMQDIDVAGPNPELAAKATITERDIESINAVTMADTMKYMPDVFIRQRFIGDANTPVGIGGTGYFQTADNMVFMDGFPLHFLLRTTFNGAPRFNMIAPEEVSSVDVIYGPFSSMYSGNAMGGVVNIHTRMPETEQATLDTVGFFQNFKLYGAEGIYGGYKTHAFYGNKIDKMSYFVSYNHLDTTSQPMNNYFTATGPFRPATTQSPVTGVIRNRNQSGMDQFMYGDSGPTKVNDDLFKIKAQYEFSPDLVARAQFALLNHDENLFDPQTYMRDATGNKFYGGAVQNQGLAFTAVNSSFSYSALQRINIDSGVGLKGNLPGDWKFDTVYSVYVEPTDVSKASSVNLSDPAYSRSGTVTDFGEGTGWHTFDFMLGNQKLLADGRLNIFAGYHFDRYSINVTQYNSRNWEAGTRDSFRASNGGKTETNAVYFQSALKLIPDWTVSAGGRQEWWRTFDGYNNSSTIQNILPEREYSKFSPKFALNYTPGPWDFQLSLAQAYRFPITGELYENITPNNVSTITASANLKPENGFTKAFMIRRDIDKGQVTLNFFEKDIYNNIYSQTVINPLGQAATTFVNIDHTLTRGIEFFVNQKDFLTQNLDTVFNVSYTTSEVLTNSNDARFVGNSLPLLPAVRLNSLNTYHLTKQWDAAVGVRYSSRPHFLLDNTDVIDTFGTSTGYIVADLKTNYRWQYQGYNLQAAAGVDNVNNEKYFFFHPFPQRTYVFQLKASF